MFGLKILEGFIKVEKEKWYILKEEDSRPTRRNTKITEGNEHRRANVLKEEAERLEIRRNFFNIRAVKAWNSIPDDVKAKIFVYAFKNAYDA